MLFNTWSYLDKIEKIYNKLEIRVTAYVIRGLCKTWTG